MGALPKRRISSARRGKRRFTKVLVSKNVKQHRVAQHKAGLFASLKKALGMA
jgi:ribosomal protein L32